MAKAVTKPGKPAGAHGTQGKRASSPASVGKRVHPTPHAKAPKARTTKAADGIYPRPAKDIATAGKPR